MEDEKLAKLADHIAQIPPLTEDGEEVPAILIKYVVLAEWLDGEGSRYLTRRAANASGDGIPAWEYRGLLHEALYGNW